MGINKPFKRTYRPFVEDIKSKPIYITHEDYADSPKHYIRAYLLLQKDFLNLLDYIEPSDTNLKTYSFRIHELLLRICIEIEANFKAILVENGYRKNTDLKMNDYKKINHSHKLSGYIVKFPVWDGKKSTRNPFGNWRTITNNSLTWWNAYNNSKHNRQAEFKDASFLNLTDAIAALTIVIASQFWTYEFYKDSLEYVVSDDSYIVDDFEETTGEYFRIKYPQWAKKDLYDFSWSFLKHDPEPFQNYDYNIL